MSCVVRFACGKTSTNVRVDATVIHYSSEAPLAGRRQTALAGISTPRLEPAAAHSARAVVFLSVGTGSNFSRQARPAKERDLAVGVTAVNIVLVRGRMLPNRVSLSALLSAGAAPLCAVLISVPSWSLAPGSIHSASESFFRQEKE